MRIPTFLLRHAATVEPYLGTWGSFGPGEQHMFAKEEKLNTSMTRAGVVRYVTVNLVGQLDINCPEGSRITLADGRVGFAQAVAQHDGGGLPTPDNTQIAFVAAAANYGSPLGGELVVLLRRVPAGRDRYQNVRYVEQEIAVEGAAVRVLSSDEKPASGGQRLHDALEVILPPDTEVDARDRMRVRGLVYEIDGRPEVEHDPLTGAEPGVRVIGRRVSGDR